MIGTATCPKGSTSCRCARGGAILTAGFLVAGCVGGGVGSQSPAPSPSAVPQASASASGCISLNIDHAQDARGRTGDVADLARTALAGLQADDVVHPTSSGTSRASVDVVRAGGVIGTIVYVSDQHGGWLIISAELCGGLEFKS